MHSTTFREGKHPVSGEPTVVATIDLPAGRLNVHFESVEHILTFCEGLMDMAAKTWPDDPWVKEYLSDETS